MNGSVKTDCLYRTADLQQGAPMAKNELAINATCKCVIESTTLLLEIDITLAFRISTFVTDSDRQHAPTCPKRQRMHLPCCRDHVTGIRMKRCVQ